jgi:hypothetical protein
MPLVSIRDIVRAMDRTVLVVAAIAWIGCSDRAARDETTAPRVERAQRVESIEREVAVAPAPEPPAEEGVTVIRTGTQATFGALRVGTGNIWEADFTDADGQSKRGLTAGLWLFFRDDAASNRHERVHEGSEVQAGDVKIHVVAVTESGIRVRTE